MCIIICVCVCMQVCAKNKVKFLTSSDSELTSIFIKKCIQFLFVHSSFGRLYKEPNRVLIKIISGHIESPLAMGQTVDGSVFICACYGHKLPYFRALRLFKLML